MPHTGCDLGEGSSDLRSRDLSDTHEVTRPPTLLLHLFTSRTCSLCRLSASILAVGRQARQGRRSHLLNCRSVPTQRLRITRLTKAFGQTQRGSFSLVLPQEIQDVNVF